jgi:LDH2 family malate/lactate/ureidoglycolate dehydrogenase
LEAAGAKPEHAADSAATLVWANLRGVDTHGVRNLRHNYIAGLKSGKIKRAATFRIEYETPITARVDGDDGLGLAAGPWAMRLAIEKAAATGVGIVAVRNSHHFGAAGAHAMLAVPHDMIGIGLTGFLWAKGGVLGVLPTFGKVPMLSTNPISVAVPTQLEDTWLLDMATSITPYNRVMMYYETGRTIPLGWATDVEGVPTTDPSVARYLMPLGGTREMGGHKGYGLSVMVEILCALLSGGWDMTEEGYNQTRDAHFFMALRIDAFRPVDEFKAGMDAMIDTLHKVPTIDGAEKVLVAGEPEANVLKTRRVTGIPLPPNVMEDLTALSTEYAIPLDLQ